MMLVAAARWRAVTPRPVAFPPKACSISFRRRPEAAAPDPGADEFLCRPVRPQQQQSTPAPAPRVADPGRRSASAVRRQIFSAECAAMLRRYRCVRRFARPAPPRSSMAAASTARRRARASAMPTAKTLTPIARRCAPIASATAESRRPGAGRSDARTSLRSGDVIATTEGLVAYTGIRLGAGQTAEFTPVASFPGLTADVRARLGEMKVAPVSADRSPPARRFRDQPRRRMPAASVPKTASTSGQTRGSEVLTSLPAPATPEPPLTENGTRTHSSRNPSRPDGHRAARREE